MKICKYGHEREDSVIKCRECNKIRSAAWVQANKERHKASGKEWRTNNQDRVVANRKNYAVEAAEKITAARKKRYAENADDFRARSNAYYYANQEAMQAKNRARVPTPEQRSNHNQKAKQRRADNPGVAAAYSRARRAANPKEPKIRAATLKKLQTGLSTCKKGHEYPGSYCYTCRCAWLERTADHREKVKAAYLLLNRDRINQQERLKYANSPEERARIAIALRKYRDENKELCTARALVNTRKRQAGKKKRTPPWYDQDNCKYIYLVAREQGMEVDHIIPLQGKLVSGLHWSHNLQPLTKEVNRSKSNKFDPATYVHELPLYPYGIITQ